MPPSLDFNWQEGDERSEKPIDDIQNPTTFGARPGNLQPHHSKKSSGPAPWGFVLLLGVGVVLGMVLGFGILTAIGQYRARADVSPIVELEHQALVQGDRELYSSLFSPEEQARQDMLDATIPLATQIYDVEDGAPKVSNVHVLGDHAEVEIEFNYDGQSYRRLENMRKVEGQWRFSRELFPVWGEFVTAEEKHVAVSYRDRDDFVAEYIPQIEATAQFFCERYRPPEPCQVDLDIQPDGDWLPHIPNDGTAAISIASPRIVGVRDDAPHPLWWLALHESIGEVIASRAFGPLPAEDDAAYTAWAALRGDVAVQAERLSGIPYEIGVSAEFVPDAPTIGRALLDDDLNQLAAAMSFAHFLVERYGESTLAVLTFQARNSPVSVNPQQLSLEWQQWREGQ